MKTSLVHHFKQNRQHQMATYSIDGLYIDGIDQRQFTGGGAAYGFHASAAYQSARSHLHFMKTLAADLKAHKKRSDAAKRGWAKRRSTMN